MNFSILEEIENKNLPEEKLAIAGIVHSCMFFNYFIFFIYPIHLQNEQKREMFLFSDLCAEGPSFM